MKIQIQQLITTCMEERICICASEWRDTVAR
jgi:hypothetical protein